MEVCRLSLKLKIIPFPLEKPRQNNILLTWTAETTDNNEMIGIALISDQPSTTVIDPGIECSHRNFSPKPHSMIASLQPTIVGSRESLLGKVG